MSDKKDRPLSYWVAVARMGFENDFQRLFDKAGMSRTELARRLNTTLAYVSKFLNSPAGNYQLETMAKWARAIDAIVQIRLVNEKDEVVRVVDYTTAAMLDELAERELSAVSSPLPLHSEARSGEHRFNPSSNVIAITARAASG